MFNCGVSVVRGDTLMELTGARITEYCMDDIFQPISIVQARLIFQPEVSPTKTGSTK